MQLYQTTMKQFPVSLGDCALRIRSRIINKHDVTSASTIYLNERRHLQKYINQLTNRND